MIMCYSTLSTEYRFLNSANPFDDFTVLQPREKDLEYFASNYNDKFYIRTNYKAKNFRLMEASVSNPGLKNWKEVIAHRDDVLLSDFEIFKNYLALNERKGGLTEIRIIEWLTDDDYYLQFEDPTYVAYFSRNPEFNTEILRYGYTSMTTPRSVYDYNMKSREKDLLKRQEVLGGYDPADYQSERLIALADDGTSVPISMVYRKGD